MAQEGTAYRELDLEELDLDELRSRLVEYFSEQRPVGYVTGKTMLREAVSALLGCSILEAENLVDTLESRGFIHYEGETQGHGIDDLEHYWSFEGGD